MKSKKKMFRSYTYEFHRRCIQRRANFKYLYGKYDESDRNKMHMLGRTKKKTLYGNKFNRSSFHCCINDKRKNANKKKKQPFVSAHNIHIQIIIERWDDRSDRRLWILKLFAVPIHRNTHNGSQWIVQGIFCNVTNDSFFFFLNVNMSL